VDATANPYLALGATIAAGLDGIRQGLELGMPVSVDPGTMTDAERQGANIERLPSTLAESIEQLRNDSVLLDALGEDLAHVYLAVRQAEWEAMRDFDLDAEVKLLLERY